jgi:hypothetical protein
LLLPNGHVLITFGARSAKLLDVGAGAFRKIAGLMPEATTPPRRRDDEVLIAGGCYRDEQPALTSHPSRVYPTCEAHPAACSYPPGFSVPR